MKFSKILMAAIAVMMIFSIVPVASAGDGTEGDPFTVLYIGYNSDSGFTDMASEGLSIVVSEITENDVYYMTDHAVIDYGEHFLPCQASIYAAAVKMYADYDYLIIDMLFTSYSYDDGGSLDGARDYLYTLADESEIVNKASIYSDDGFDSYAPESFSFRDQLSYSEPSTFATRMNIGLNAIGYGSTVADYEMLLSYLN